MNEEKIEVYPWAVPTDEQIRMFDALSYEEQLEMLRNTLIEAENSGVSDRTPKEIVADVIEKLRRNGEL